MEEDKQFKKQKKKKVWFFVVGVLTLVVILMIFILSKGWNMQKLFNIDRNREQLSPIILQAGELETSTSYTESSMTICDENKKCTVTLYSGVQFINENNQWKKLYDANSLKTDNFRLEIDLDESFNVTIEDYNYTNFKNICFSSNITGNIPLKIYRYNETCSGKSCIKEVINEYNILIPNTIPNMWRCFNITLIKPIFDYTIKWGINSTTIKLQDADIHNLDDDAVVGEGNFPTMYIDDDDSGSYGDAFVKFNISMIPSGQQIDDVLIRFYIDEGTFDAGDIVGIWGVDNYTWNEEDGVTIALRTVNGQNLFNRTDVTGSNVWDKTWNSTQITQWVQDVYTSGKKNVTFGWWMFDDPDSEDDYAAVRTKEDSSSSTRIYMNITYSEAGGDTCTYDVGDWNIDCTDSCDITSNVNGGGNDFTATGAGTITLNANVTGFARYHIFGGCNIVCQKGCINYM